MQRSRPLRDRSGPRPWACILETRLNAPDSFLERSTDAIQSDHAPHYASTLQTELKPTYELASSFYDLLDLKQDEEGLEERQSNLSDVLDDSGRSLLLVECSLLLVHLQTVHVKDGICSRRQPSRSLLIGQVSSEPDQQT